MRILVLSNMYPPHHLGGNELSCRDMVRCWRERGHDVEVLTSDLRFESGEDDDDPRVARSLKLYWQDYRVLSPSYLDRFRLERTNQRTLKATLDRFTPDVVSVWHMGAMSFGLLTQLCARDLPTVLVVCDDYLTYGPTMDAWTRAFSRLPRSVARVVERVASVPTAPRLPRVVAACFNSAWMRDRSLASSTWTFDRVTVVYSGIDTTAFGQRADASSWGGRLVCVGRVEERKGVHVAIDALVHLPGATLDVIGPGVADYVSMLNDRARALGVTDRIRFMGPKPRHATAEAVRDADAFVFPVLWDEPFGLAPVEAMASGTPVVGSATGGSAEFLIDGTNALVVDRGDAVGLAEAVRRLSADEALRRRLVEAGSKTAALLANARLCDVLEAWHIAAARRFVDGDPPHRPSLTDELRETLRRSG